VDEPISTRKIYGCHALWLLYLTSLNWIVVNTSEPY